MPDGASETDAPPRGTVAGAAEGEGERSIAGAGANFPRPMTQRTKPAETFDEKLSQGALAYNTAGYLDITGPLDLAVFRAAAAALMAEAECVRTRFFEVPPCPDASQHPWQVALRSLHIDLEEVREQFARGRFTV